MDEPDEDLGGRLTEAARDVTESLTADQITAIRRYQALDRTYELVAAVVRGRLSPDDLTAEQSADVLGIIDGLDLATERWRLPERVRAYRGQRSIGRLFGSGPRVGAEIEAESFLSTSIHRRVAIDEFTAPTGTGGPVLFEIQLPEGASALWVPPVGDPELAYQGELLLPRRTRLGVRAERDEAGILVLDCEVLL